MAPRQKTLSKTDEVRREVAHLLGHQIAEPFWAYLAGHYQRDIDEITTGFADSENVSVILSMLAEACGDLEEHIDPAQGRRRQTRRTRVIPPDKRLTALSHILAAEAGRLPAVAEFREDVLGGRLLAPAEADAWIRAQEASQPSGPGWVSVGLPTNLNREKGPLGWLRPLAVLSDEQLASLPHSSSLETIQYFFPGDEVAHFARTRWDSPLGRLKRIARLLSVNGYWDEADAVTVILTGYVPIIPKATVRWYESDSVPPRISLDLDPRLSSHEVAMLYAKARDEVFRGRDKPMTDKHLALAIFYDRHRDLTWSAMMCEWNRQHPEWAYKATKFGGLDYWRGFARDARAAWSRVTGRKWVARPSRQGKKRTGSDRTAPAGVEAEAAATPGPGPKTTPLL